MFRSSVFRYEKVEKIYAFVRSKQRFQDLVCGRADPQWLTAHLECVEFNSDNLESRIHELNATFGADCAAVSCLGTTRKTAGTSERFRDIDFGLNMAIAKACFKKGADPKSRFLYPRVKGELEEMLQTVGFQQVVIYRPTLLLTKPRPETRPLESALQTFSRWIDIGGFWSISAKDVARAIAVDLTGKTVQGCSIRNAPSIKKAGYDPRGDAILQRSFRKRLVKHVGELFLKHVRKSTAGPIVVVEECDTTFVYLQKSGLYFVFALSTVAVPLSVACDLLESLIGVVKDMCGVLTEDNLRKNFLLLNEIVDEMFDYGIVVAHDTQQLVVALSTMGGAVAGQTSRSPFSLDNASSWAKDVLGKDTVARLASSFTSNEMPNAPRTIPSHASQLPVSKVGSSEIFVDIKDWINAEIKANDGSLIRGSLTGSIVVKSYLDDYPALRLGLNEELALDNPYLCSPDTPIKANSLVLDDCVFDDCVDPSSLASEKSLTFSPKKGEFTLMKYRAQKFTLPFTLTATCSVVDGKVEIVATLCSQTPKEISGYVNINLQLPEWAGSCNVAKTTGSNQQKVYYTQAEKTVTWVNRTIEIPARAMTSHQPPCGFACRFDVQQDIAPAPVVEALKNNVGDIIAKYIAPFRVQFELPMYSSSRLQIRYLRCNAGMTPPQRWVRYVTQSGSFVATLAS